MAGGPCPPSAATYFGSYKRWVRAHTDALAMVESALSTITWLLPDRFSDNEFTLEGIHTLSNLIGVFHDSILNENDRAPKGASELTLALNALQQIEVLVELYAVHSGNGRRINRYDALLVVESLKALVRLAIFRKSDGRLMLHGGAEGMFDGGDTDDDDGYGDGDGDGDGRGDRRGDGRGDGRDRTDSKANMVLKAFQAFRESRTPMIKDERLRRIDDLVERTNRLASKRLFAGEICFIMRPVVYVGMLRVFGIRSWKPWLVSLAVELASAELTRSAWARSNDSALRAARDLASSTGSSIASLYARQGIKLSSRELDELTRRKVLLLLYLLRDPLFGRRTQPVLQAVLGTTSRVPLVGWALSLPVSLLEGIQRYYTYTSGA